MIERDVKETLILNSANPGDVLRILVENRGRTCISEGLPYATPDSKVTIFKNISSVSFKAYVCHTSLSVRFIPINQVLKSIDPSQ